MNIYMFMNPKRVIPFLNRELAIFLLHKHFPWIILDDDPIYLYKEGYLCTIGKSKTKYQKQYDNWIIPQLTNFIQDKYLVNEESIYRAAYEYMYDPVNIQKISLGLIDNELNDNITNLFRQ